MAARHFAPLILGCLRLRGTADSQEKSSGLRLVGSAKLTGKGLRLTPAERHMAGAAWFEEKQMVSGGFVSRFEFQLTRFAAVTHDHSQGVLVSGRVRPGGRRFRLRAAE